STEVTLSPGSRWCVSIKRSPCCRRRSICVQRWLAHVLQRNVAQKDVSYICMLPEIAGFVLRRGRALTTFWARRFHIRTGITDREESGKSPHHLGRGDPVEM